MRFPEGQSVRVAREPSWAFRHTVRKPADYRLGNTGRIKQAGVAGIVSVVHPSGVELYYDEGDLEAIPAPTEQEFVDRCASALGVPARFIDETARALFRACQKPGPWNPARELESVEQTAAPVLHSVTCEIGPDGRLVALEDSKVPGDIVELSRGDAALVAAREAATKAFPMLVGIVASDDFQYDEMNDQVEITVRAPVRLDELTAFAEELGADNIRVHGSRTGLLLVVSVDQSPESPER